MSSPEFKIGQIVKIADGSEYPYINIEDETGVVARTIPPDSKNPHRVIVSLDGKGLINLLSEHLEKVDPQ